MNIKKYIGVLAMMTILLVSCNEDFLEPELSTSKDLEGGITTVSDLRGVLLGVLNRMSDDPLYGRDAIVLGEVRSDNAISNGNSGRFVVEGRFQYTTESGIALSLWDQAYEAISSANLVIHSDVEGDEAEINHIKGQAYALRALNYFTLLTAYGQMHTGGSLGVPIVREFVDSSNPIQPERATIDATWDFIKEDLDMAFSLMSEDLNGPNTLPTTYMAKALEARVDLYTDDFAGAIIAAEYVVNSGEFSLLSGTSYVDSWEADDSQNVIFQLGMNDTDNQGINGLYYMYRPTGYGDVEATADLASIYEAGDIRNELFDVTDGVIRTKKYPSFSSNVKLITYAEVVLIYAEALLQNGNANALSVLNQIPAARNATPYAGATMANILLERRKELAFEGFRFYDLIRTGKDIPARAGFSELIPYGDDRLALPIPRAELDANPNIEQNSGYAD